MFRTTLICSEAKGEVKEMQAGYQIVFFVCLPLKNQIHRADPLVIII